MKYLTLICFVVFSLAIISCKGEHKNHDNETKEMAMMDKYQCPMDCEKGKTYDKEGKCPVCEMDLKKIEAKSEAHGHGHNHEEDKSHDSKEGDTHQHKEGNGHNH